MVLSLMRVSVKCFNCLVNEYGSCWNCLFVVVLTIITGVHKSCLSLMKHKGNIVRKEVKLTIITGVH